MAQSAAYKHFLRIINRWPKDILRPEVSFEKALRRRVDAQFLPKPPTGVGKDGAPLASATPAPIAEAAALKEANVLYSLLENRYSNKYPLSESYLRPASNPTHYTDLLAELEAAPKRTWLQQRLNKWKGFLRFS
ncbi:MAG: hypothetical protein M1838_003503 [Thelocarpon superellum]|nr:MAG: hypothetical protein M1838_003503 [Thelocarpon superellum]